MHPPCKKIGYTAVEVDENRGRSQVIFDAHEMQQLILPSVEAILLQ